MDYSIHHHHVKVVKPYSVAAVLRYQAHRWMRAHGGYKTLLPSAYAQHRAKQGARLTYNPNKFDPYKSQYYLDTQIVTDCSRPFVVFAAPDMSRQTPGTSEARSVSPVTGLTHEVSQDSTGGCHQGCRKQIDGIRENRWGVYRWYFSGQQRWVVSRQVW